MNDQLKLAEIPTETSKSVAKVEKTYEFGGKNKARRLKKAVEGGKTAKAEKLAKKVAVKIKKLEGKSKDKTSTNRYKKLTNALTAGVEKYQTIAEMEEVETVMDEVVADEPEFDNELDAAEKDEADGTSAEKGADPFTASARWVSFLPNWATITIPVVAIAGTIGSIWAYKHFNK